MKTGGRTGLPNILYTPILYAVGSASMRAAQHTSGAFQKVGECLYRYSSNGVYYARVRTDGKEVRRSLGTRDPALARRKLADFRRERREIDHSQGKLTLSEINFC
jgi:hypothetical protein